MSIVLLATSLAVSFAVAEVVLRRVEPPFFAGHMRYHGELGWVVRPGTLLHPRRGEREVRVEYNRLGFRDVEHAVERPAGVRRIVVVGDSFTEAAQVELEETYWSVLQRLLAGQGRDSWEVIGLGVGAYGTAQELLALEEVGMGYAPELVILQIFPFNDVINNSLSGAYVANPHDTYRPYPDPGTDFRTLTYLNPKTSWLRRRSAVFRYSFLVAHHYLGAWGREKVFRDDRERQDFVARHSPRGVPQDLAKSALLMNSLAPPAHQSAIIREGWAATDSTIRRIHEITEAGGARLMLLVIPHVRLFEGRLRELREKVPFPTDLRYPEARIAALLPADEVPVIELVDVFENHLDIVLPIPAGHLNTATHRLIAELLLPEVNRILPN